MKKSGLGLVLAVLDFVSFGPSLSPCKLPLPPYSPVAAYFFQCQSGYPQCPEVSLISVSTYHPHLSLQGVLLTFGYACHKKMIGMW